MFLIYSIKLLPIFNPKDKNRNFKNFPEKVLLMFIGENGTIY